MRILLTRPREDSEKLAARLHAMGHEVVVEPVIVIHPEPEAPLDLDGVQALVFTSANGARAFAQRSPTRDLPVFAVGDATATAAHEFGFAHVESAGGDVVDLARLVRERLRAEHGAILHAAGSVVAGDLVGHLTEAGFDVRRAVLYRAEPAESLSPEAEAAISAGQIDVATFFSPRTAASFAALARKAGLDAACAAVTLVALSPAVAAAADLPWRRREIAAAPTETALLDVIARVAAETPGEASEAPRPVDPPKPSRAGWVAPVGVAIALAAAALGLSAWREFNRPPDSNAALAQAQQRLDALERDSATKLGALERDIAARLAGAEQGRAALARNVETAVARVAALEARLNGLSKQLESTAGQLEQLSQEPRGADPARLAALTSENRRLAQELARLQEEVGAMNGAMGERAESRREPLVLAIGALRDAVARGASYASELAAARGLAGDDAALVQALAALAPSAERGIPTRGTLRARFERVATDVVRAAQAPAGDGWGQWLGRLMGAVSIRPVGEVEGDTPTAIVARAERRVGADDLAGAVAELGKLTGPAAVAAQTWLADARARLAAESALARAAALALRIDAKVAP